MTVLVAGDHRESTAEDVRATLAGAEGIEAKADV